MSGVKVYEVRPRYARALLMTIVTGLILAAVIYLLGGPLWAAVGMGALVTEIRTSRVMANPPEEAVDPNVAYVRKLLSKDRAA